MNCSHLIEPPPDMRFRWSHNGSVAICYSLVFALALLGNGAMFLILFRNQCVKKRRVHSLLLHMTMAQLLVTLVYIPKEIVHNLTIAWLGGDLLCRLCKFFDVFGVVLSAGILVCLSLDRFYSILFPLYVINAKRSVQRMVSVAWALSILSSLPQVYIFRTAQHPCFPHFTQCVSADLIGLVSPRLVYWFSVLNIVQVYIIPLLVTIFCYSAILISLKSGSAKANANHDLLPEPQRNVTKLALVRGECVAHSENNHSMAGGRQSRPRTSSLGPNLQPRETKRASETSVGLRRSGGGSSYERARSRTLKMTVVVILAFLFCWTPYTIAMFIHFLRVQSATRPIPPLLSKFLYAFAVFNSAISPYLYGYFSFNLRDECRQLSFLLYRSVPRCLLPPSESNDSIAHHHHRAKNSLGANAAVRGSRRRAMIRRESRLPEGASMCEQRRTSQQSGCAAGPVSVRFVSDHRAPRLSESMRTVSSGTQITRSQ